VSGMSEMDREVRAVVAALADRVRLRDEADEEDRPDPEPLASEFVGWLRLRGWRPTPAQAPPPWTPAGVRGADPRRHAEALADVREACAGASAKLRAAELESETS